MAVYMDVLPRLGLREAEAAVAAAKRLFTDAGNEVGRAFGGSAEAGMKSLQDEYGRTAQVAVDASRAQVSAQGELDTAIARTASVLENYGAASTQAATAQRALVDAQVQATVATKAQKDAMDGAVAAHLTAASAATNHTGAIAAIAGANKVGLASTVLFTAAVVESTKAAGNFEASQTRLVTSAGESAGALKQSSDGILKLAGDTGVSADKLSQAMYVVNSAGYTVANGGLEVLKAAAQGANNENADLGVTANAVTTALHDYHLGADQAALVTSKMITAISNGKTNMQEFSSSLHSVQPIAASLGINIDDLYGSLAAMTASGESADQATQNMADALRHLSSPTKTMSDELAQVGIDSRELTANLDKRGLAGSMQDISTAILQHMGPSGTLLLTTFNQSKQAADDAKTAMAALPPQVQKIAQEFQNGEIGAAKFRKEIGEAGITADMKGLATQWLSAEQRAGGFNSMLKSGGPDVQTYTQALQKATGDAASMNVALQLTGENGEKTNEIIKKVGETTTEAGNNVKGTAEYQDTFNAKLKDANAAFHAAGIELGDVFLPALTHVAGGLKTVADFLEQHKSLAGDLVIGIGAIGAAWLAAKGIMVFDTIITGLGRMATGLGLVKTEALAVNEAIGTKMATAAAVGESGVVAASTAEVAAQGRVLTAAGAALSKLGLVATAAFAAYEAGQSSGNAGQAPGLIAGQGMPAYTNSIQAELDALKPGALPSGAGQYGGPGAQAEHRGALPAPPAAPADTTPPVIPPPDDLLGPNLGTGAPPGSEDAKKPKKQQAAQVPYPAEYGAPPRPGETEQQYRDEQNLLEQHHKVAEAAARLAAVEQDSTHTTEDLIKAQNDLAAARKDEYDAQLKTADAVSKTTTQMTDFGVALDKDLGLSKGLPGLADNLVRFLGNLAAAPLLGPLSAISAAQGGIDKTGSGLIGIAAAQGAFGQQYTPEGQAAAAASGSGGGFSPSGSAASGGGLAALLNSATGAGGDAAAAAATTSGIPIPAGGVGAERWRQTVAQTIAKYGPQMGIPSSQYKVWEDAIVSQIGVESSGNAGASNPHDSNGRGGTQDVEGLLQYLPSSYANSGGKLTGLPYMDPVGQIAGALFAPRTASGAPNVAAPGGIGAGHGWGPTAYSPSAAAAPPAAGPAAPPGRPGYVPGIGFVDSSGNPTGYNPGKPPGYSSGGSVDTVPIMGQPGEHMLTVDDVKAMGGQSGVYDFRRSLHMQTGGGVPYDPMQIIGGSGPGSYTPKSSPLPTKPVSNPLQNIAPASTSPPASAAPSPAPAPAAPAPPRAGSGAPPGPSDAQIGGADPKNAPGGSQSGGGLVGAATGAAAMAADMFAPGSGAAVQIASQEAQRAIKFAGQATAIGIGGLMDTFLPFGGSDLANNNWLTRGASAFAGVQPQIPNLAGKSASVDAMQKNPQTAQPMPLPRPLSSSDQGSGPAPGPTVVNNTFHVTNTGAANDTNEKVLADHVGKQYEPVGSR